MGVAVGMDRDLARVLKWVGATEGSDRLPGAVVPGANVAERTQLALLGDVTRAVFETPAFSSDLDVVTGVPEVKTWLSGDVDAPEQIADALARISGQSELVASLYSSTVAASRRRRLGTFFTPDAQVERMLDSCVEAGVDPTTVIDVGAGVGIFSVAAAERWPEASVDAVDINPVTLGLLGLRASAAGLLTAPRAGAGVVLRYGDYIDYLDSEYVGTPAPRLILGNPPYTRSQLLPQDERSRLIDAAGGLCGARASLSALMTAASLLSLKESDALCLLLPAQWLEADYARGLRNEIWGLTRRPVRLELFTTKLFKEAQVDAVSLFVGPERDRPQNFVTTVFEGAAERSFDRREADQPATWRAMFPSDTVRPSVRATSAEPTVPLSLLAKVTRGAATGANRFFVLTDKQVQHHKLPSQVLRPLVRRSRDHINDEVAARMTESNDSGRWWLFVAGEGASAIPEVAAYISLGASEGHPDAYLCRKRKRWFDLSGEARVHDVVVGPSMKDGRIRFLQNTAGAYITNNLYGLDWHAGVPDDCARAVLDWLRSDDGQAAMLERAHSHGVGLLKLEPRALQTLPVPRDLMPDLVDSLLVSPA